MEQGEHEGNAATAEKGGENKKEFDPRGNSLFQPSCWMEVRQGKRKQDNRGAAGEAHPSTLGIDSGCKFCC